MIEIRHLRKEYETVTPLMDVNTVINKGDVVSIIGPSGTGKSTLLRCINRLEWPTSGEVLVDGVNIMDESINIDRIRKKLGMVFQAFNLYTHLTVIENTMIGQIRLLKRSRQEAYDHGMKMLRLVGMEEKALEYPDNLSGGQKQRAAIARTLAMDPEVILFDEPTSALDPRMTKEVIEVMRTLASHGRTMLIVTHSMDLAKLVSNRIFYMDEGGIYEEGTVDEIFNNPKRDKTREFLIGMDSMTILYAHKDFDYNADMIKIQSYGLEMGFDAKKIYRLQLVYEEMQVNYLYSQLGEQDYCETKFEYDRKHDRMSLYVNYWTEYIRQADPNKLGYEFMWALCKSITWTDTQDSNGLYNFSIVIWDGGMEEEKNEKNA